MDSAVRDRIGKLVSENAVVLFMKGSRGNPACGFSAKAVQILDSLLQSYTTVDVLSDPAIRDGVKAYSQWPTIPQLYVRGEFVGGSDIIAALLESGELEEKLGELAAVPTPSITVTEAAARELAAALEEPGEAVRLDITAHFEHDLAIGVPDPRDIVVESAGIRIAVTRASAQRANGLRIDVITTPEGPAFKLDNPNQPPAVVPMTAAALAQRLEQKDVLLIDVRTDEERRIAQIQGARPLDQDLVAELDRLPKHQPIVVHCHHGVRSMRLAEELVQNGFREVYNLSGGIDAWSLTVDPSVPRY